MPTYSYRCTECSNAFDIQQAFTDDSLTECPVCGGRLRKVFSAVGVSFTGSGFYRNDSRAADKAAAAKNGGSGSGTDSTSSSDTSSSSGGSGGGESVASKTPAPAPAPAPASSAPPSPASS